MPDIPKDKFDLAGFSVGIVSKKILEKYNVKNDIVLLPLMEYIQMGSHL